jgi:uncharacterized membrane protein YraQ (UPF0718 family)
MVALVRRYRWSLLVLGFDLIVLLVRPQTGLTLFRHSWNVVAQMLAVLPPVFLLLGLMDAWVPRETVIRFVGERSGILGTALSIVLGAAAAGPLYGAFPIAQTMARKGASYFNIVVFLGAWSTLKIPMFLFETSALGARFSVTRWIVNVAGIVLMAWVAHRVLSRKDKDRLAAAEEQGPTKVVIAP